MSESVCALPPKAVASFCKIDSFDAQQGNEEGEQKANLALCQGRWGHKAA